MSNEKTQPSGPRPRVTRTGDPEDESPVRKLRVPDALWVAASEKAAAEGRRPSAVFRDLLRAYVAGDGR